MTRKWMMTMRPTPKKVPKECLEAGGGQAEWDRCANEIVEFASGTVRGWKVKSCTFVECTNKVYNGGICIRQGAKGWVNSCGHEGYWCNHGGCANQARSGGVCHQNGAYYKHCSHRGVIYRSNWDPVEQARVEVRASPVVPPVGL